jgi:acetolactate synthase-1/2/3 large subunit
VIQLDINPMELGRNYPNTVSLAGDAKVALRSLIGETRPNPGGARNEWLQRVQQFVAGWRAEAAPFLNSDAVPMRPERICQEISESLPAGGVVVSDTGHSGIWSGTMIDLTKPGQRYIRSAGSLGWGFPGALGVKCALPDQPVLCFTGDGGFYYHLSELETAARYGIHVVVLVNNNSALNQEIPLIRGAYGTSPSDRADEMWRFQNVDFVKVAESLGCIGFRVQKPGELKDLLPRTFTMGKPVVIDAITDVNAFSQKPLSH